MIAIILNEAAASGKASRQLGAIENYLAEIDMDCRILRTQHPGHATLLARRCAEEGFETVFSMGGDGLAQEVARGLYGTDTPMGILPAGTGNDFAKALSLPKDPLQALKQSLDAEPRPIDVGLINGEVFLNIVGTGFDIQTLLWAHKFKFLGRGMISYLLGAICAIAAFKPVRMEMTFDGEPVSQAITVITAANGQYFGGGMHVAPQASVTDGWLDIFYVDALPRLMIPFLLPRLIGGTAATLKPAHTRRCKKVTLKSAGQIMDVDGEFLPSDEVTIEIAEKALQMRY